MTKPDWNWKLPLGEQEARFPYPPAAQTDAASNRQPKPGFVVGLSDFAADYDLFLVDQWGVLHDGRAAYPGVGDCLRRLLALGKRVVILSNSGRRAETNASQLGSMGVTEDCYTLLVTSGEIARESLAARTPPFPPALGGRCLLLSSDGEGALVQGLDLELAPTVATADFILLAGVGDDQPMAFYQRILDHAGAHRIPLVCANPDLLRLSRKGLVFSAGEVARCYERMGGQVHYIGKPYPMIYEYCRKVLPDFESSRVIAVGDSYFHDVAGGAGFGLATAFITGGIHKADFPDTLDEAGRFRRLADFAREYEAWPDWVIPRFRW
jgi:HAD superfamily hydrolase (TIGR01459 family)